MENSLAQNRAEELGYDLWEDFVIPPFFNSLDLLSAKKPRVIVGGRGCGKTSLLRYLCHDTQFSKKRSLINNTELANIGIYWRIDTNFAKILSQRGLEDHIWNSAFEHLSVLMISREILKSLESIGTSSIETFSTDDLKSFNFNILSSFLENVPADFFELKNFIRKEINRFQTWAGSIRTFPQPVFLPLNFIKELIIEIKNQNLTFNDSNYLIYVDEYENLLAEQQKLINTWVKHSETPLIFNLAMKPHSFNNKNTIGNEPIAETHDYREYNLEEFYLKTNFELFAAEILFLRLWKNDHSYKIPIIPDELKKVSNEILEKRVSDDYTKKVLKAAKDFFPGNSTDDIANDIFKEPILKRRLTDLILKAIESKKYKITAEELLVEDYPQAGIIIPALLNRNHSIEDIKTEISKLLNGKNNKFTGSTGWIHNNVYACILMIYEPLGRFCPLYSGFEAFCLMSKTNLRHFLELSYKSITNENLNNSKSKKDFISIRSQAEGAKQASSTFLREVKNFGNEGNKLHTFVLRLGTYFSYSHKKPAQSEPEQNHFNIVGNKSTELSNFINEAVKWSVLYESRITKQKGGENNLQSEDYEYILNPIYAPYFHISYRKKRSVQFTSSELSTIAFGDFKEFEVFLNIAAKKWKIIPDESSLDLFTEIEN
ncbi:hypothetical protein L1S34_14085 [Flavobacterium sp. K77]|uniref:ORC-CDC6 family AAA ATPase n=1 Tax=Flavobacterium sp. K77 TaxID=2910676 RepID=UPI001F2915F4|nr:hypothetical protein [Flavobacterium sp. K77]MCF6142421.1 hypothetical protein [Flavobacterium sp. K77]